VIESITVSSPSIVEVAVVVEAVFGVGVGSVAGGELCSNRAVLLASVADGFVNLTLLGSKLILVCCGSRVA
jgi:hypothetical protein